MHYDPDDIYVAESTAIVAAAGVTRMHILLREKGVISDDDLERARIFALRDLEVFFGTSVPTQPVHGKLEARRAMLGAYWTPRNETTQEPVRRGDGERRLPGEAVPNRSALRDDARTGNRAY